MKLTEAENKCDKTIARRIIAETKDEICTIEEKMKFQGMRRHIISTPVHQTVILRENENERAQGRAIVIPIRKTK
jgi:hypothetical protein